LQAALGEQTEITKQQAQEYDRLQDVSTQQLSIFEFAVEVYSLSHIPCDIELSD